MVVICLPVTADSGVTQERIGAPSACTVQAPHNAIPQPYLVPVRLATSRSAHSRGISSGASRAVSVPLMFKLAMADVFLDWRGPRPTDVQDKKSAPAAAMPITTPFLPDPANVQAGGSALSARAALAHGLRQEFDHRPGPHPTQPANRDGNSVAPLRHEH